MAFDIIFQVNHSEKNALTKNVEDYVKYTGVLKDGTSIIDPVIEVRAEMGTLSICNYMTIAAFNRMYFITDIRSTYQDLIEVTAHVDVLSTYAEQIRTNTAVVRRQQNNWNLNLNDGFFKTYQNPIILTRNFARGLTHDEFILAVAGGN